MKVNRVRILLLSALIALSGCGKLKSNGESDSESGADIQIDDSTDSCATVVNSIEDGYSCKCASDCLPGGTCVTEVSFGFPRGICLRSCTPGDESCAEDAICDASASTSGVFPGACDASCEDDSDCDQGKFCYEGNCCYRGKCLLDCETTSDCPPAQVCSPGQGCYPLCQSDDDCLSKSCNRYTTTCINETDGYGLNETCIRDEQCKSHFCHPTLAICITSCSVERQGCPEEAICVPIVLEDDTGICAHSCEDDDDCDIPGHECVKAPDGTKVCHPPADPEVCLEPEESIEDGSPCNCDAECLRGARCQTEAESGWPGGVCIRTCLDETDCFSDFTCRSVSGVDEGYCSPNCETHDDCPSYRICQDGSCRAFCQTDSDCLTGTCNIYNGNCGEIPDDRKGVMAPCDSASDCRSNICGSNYHCLSPCATENQSCPEGAICVPADSAYPEIGICFFECSSDGACEDPDLSCIELNDETAICS